MALIAILFHSGAYTAVFVNFQLNQSFIASTLCVNRNSPELKCEGKCYLIKQLTQQEQQNQANGLLSVQQSLTWFYETAITNTDVVIPEVLAKQVFHHQQLHTQHYTAPRPQPPCLA